MREAATVQTDSTPRCELSTSSLPVMGHSVSIPLALDTSSPTEDDVLAAELEKSWVTQPPLSTAALEWKDACDFAPLGDGALSKRGQRLLNENAFPQYLSSHFQRVAENAYDEVTNPTGYIQLCIAENRLMWDMVQARMRECRAVRQEEFAYGDMRGREYFRRVLSKMMESAIVGRPVDPDHLCVLAGTGCVLESLAWCLCDDGDAVLIPTPMYAGFEMDFRVRPRVTTVPVYLKSTDEFKLTRPLLDEAMSAAEAKGHRVRMLMLCSPHNPLGRVYTAQELTDIVDWAREKPNVHLLVDEIYALSVHDPDAKFVSVARIMKELGNRVHLQWGFSKDFCMNGLRCGLLYSQNKPLRDAINAVSYWMSVSGDTQFALSKFISDRAFIHKFVQVNAQRLRAQYEACYAFLTALGATCIKASAGHFLVVGLQKWMPKNPTWEDEAKLWTHLLDSEDVNLTPGSACMAAEPGWFRLCFAAVDEAKLAVALRRLKRALEGEHARVSVKTSV